MIILNYKIPKENISRGNTKAYGFRDSLKENGFRRKVLFTIVSMRKDMLSIFLLMLRSFIFWALIMPLTILVLSYLLAVILIRALISGLKTNIITILKF